MEKNTLFEFMNSNSVVILTVVFSQHCLIKMLSISDLAWSLDLGFPGFFCILSKRCLVCFVSYDKYYSVCLRVWRIGSRREKQKRDAAIARGHS